ncbi:hypothetical protein B0H14DRAFT_3508652 [Mycena olivaceomarginata]|nr:hypothetical protein B0H14DRAFT_3508652 [Mycena olivaceomarginata]
MPKESADLSLGRRDGVTSIPARIYLLWKLRWQGGCFRATSVAQLAFSTSSCGLQHRIPRYVVLSALAPAARCTDAKERDAHRFLHSQARSRSTRQRSLVSVASLVIAESLPPSVVYTITSPHYVLLHRGQLLRKQRAAVLDIAGIGSVFSFPQALPSLTAAAAASYTHALRRGCLSSTPPPTRPYPTDPRYGPPSPAPSPSLDAVEPGHTANRFATLAVAPDCQKLIDFPATHSASETAPRAAFEGGWNAQEGPAGGGMGTLVQRNKTMVPPRQGMTLHRAKPRAAAGRAVSSPDADWRREGCSPCVPQSAPPLFWSSASPAPTSAPCAQLGPAAPVETADFHVEGTRKVAPVPPSVTPLPPPREQYWAHSRARVHQIHCRRLRLHPQCEHKRPISDEVKEGAPH